MMMMSLAPTGKNPDDIPTFTGHVTVNGSTASQPEPWQETDSIEEDDDGIDPQEPDSRNVLNGVLGHVVNQLKQHEDSLRYLISEGASNTSYTAKEYQDYLKDYVVNGIGWEAPEADKEAYANRAIYKELPNAMQADTNNEMFSPTAKAFLQISTGAIVLPEAPAPVATPPVTQGVNPRYNPQYGGQIEARVNPSGDAGVQRFVAPKVSLPKYSPSQESYHPFFAGQQQEALIRDLVIGFHKMQNRWYTRYQPEPVRIASNDNIGFDVPPQNNTLLASAEVPNKQLGSTVKENSYTSRKPDAQLLPKYKNDKTQFPTSPTNKAPNVTARYDEYVRASIVKYEALRRTEGFNAMSHFGTGKALDLKGQYGLPKAGQYAVVHGRIVTDAWIANAQYGEVMNHIMENHPEDFTNYAIKAGNLYERYGNTAGSTVKHFGPPALKYGGTGTKEWAAMEAAQAFARLSGLKYDQPEDQAAIKWGVDKAVSRQNKK